MSESDENNYTVHEIRRDGRTKVKHRPIENEGVEDTSSLLSRYYPLGTRERHTFDEHMRRLKEQAALVEQDRQFRESHPFRPNTTASSASAPDTAMRETHADPQRSSEPPFSPSVGSSPSPSNVRPVFDRLAAQALQLEMRRRHREEQRRRTEAAALRDAFQPHINHRAPIYAERLQHLNSVRVEDRLLHYGEMVARERQRKQELSDLESTLAWKSAQASLFGSGPVQSRNPEDRRRQQDEFDTRTARFLAERSKHLQSAEAAAAESFPFHPRISATSAALDEARQRSTTHAATRELGELLNRSVDVPALDISKATHCRHRRSDALYALAVSRQRRRNQHLDQSAVTHVACDEMVEKGMASGSTSASHHPLTNPTSDKWIAKGAHSPFFRQSFVQRQALYEEVKREEEALRATTMQTQEQREGGAVAHSVNAKALNDRLYYSAKKASEEAQRLRRASLSARECPFRPQLSPGTKCVLLHMSSRDSDVVRRLTTHRSRGVCGGMTTAVDSELYSPARNRPAHRQVPPHIQSQKQKTGGNNSEEVVSGSAPKKNISPSTSPPGETQVAATDDNADDSPFHQQREKSNRLVVTRDQIDKFYLRQMNAIQHKHDLIQERKEGEAAQELVECTFRPRTNTDRHVGSEDAAHVVSKTAASVKQVTGVSKFLERQTMARMRKREHEELLRTIGLPRNKGVVNSNASAGTTILSPFKLQTENRFKQSTDPPACTSTSAPETGRAYDSEFPSVAALATAERALHDAIRESRGYPASSAQAPLFPLPGYLPKREEIPRFSGKYHHVSDPKGVLRSASPESRFAESAGGQGRGGTSTVGLGNERLSLFSLISPNTYSGRSLGAARSNFRNDNGALLAREVTANSTSPSALKGGIGHRGASANRRSGNRSVSFAEESSEAPPTETTSEGRRVYADPAHVAFLNGDL